LTTVGTPYVPTAHVPDFQDIKCCSDTYLNLYFGYVSVSRADLSILYSIYPLWLEYNNYVNQVVSHY